MKSLESTRLSFSPSFCFLYHFHLLLPTDNCSRHDVIDCLDFWRFICDQHMLWQQDSHVICVHRTAPCRYQHFDLVQMTRYPIFNYITPLVHTWKLRNNVSQFLKLVFLLHFWWTDFVRFFGRLSVYTKSLILLMNSIGLYHLLYWLLVVISWAFFLENKKHLIRLNKIKTACT